MNSVQNLFQQSKPIVMAILNLTPDSFSDGMQGASVKDYLKKADVLIGQGAHVLDIGGESTRPNADFVSVEQEKFRVIPFLRAFRLKYPDFPVSLDTRRYEVVSEAVTFGIQIINDVSFLSDSRLLDIARRHDCYYVLMHCRGDARDMMQRTEYPEGVFQTIKMEIEEKLLFIEKKGLSFSRLILDPGFGFAKTPQQCMELMEDLSGWRHFHLPLLFGVSRKRFIQQYTGENEPLQRDQKSAELARKAYQQGFQMLRVHDVAATLRSCA